MLDYKMIYVSPKDHRLVKSMAAKRGLSIGSYVMNLVRGDSVD